MLLYFIRLNITNNKKYIFITKSTKNLHDMIMYLSTCLIRKIYVQTSRLCRKMKRTREKEHIVVREERVEEGEGKGRKKEKEEGLNGAGWRPGREGSGGLGGGEEKSWEKMTVGRVFSLPTHDASARHSLVSAAALCTGATPLASWLQALGPRTGQKKGK